jgi:Leucine-rich repeat (LRR) protein
MSVVEPLPEQLDTIYNGMNLNLSWQPDLSQQRQLKTIYLQDNRLQSIHIGLFPPEVEHLNLSTNRLGYNEVRLEFPPTLKTLNLDDNPIQTADVLGQWPSNLEELSLNETQLKSSPRGLPQSLHTFSISGCNLITLDRLPYSLKKLDASCNQIRQLDLLPRNLVSLHLGINSLRSDALFRARMPPNLRYLNLDHNQLTELPDNLPDTIEYLSVKRNYLRKVPTSYPKQLRMLILTENRILEFSPQWKEGQRLLQLHIGDNCICENLINYQEENRVQTVYQANNWNQEIHHIYAWKIQKAFHMYWFKKAIRCWARVGHIKAELMEIAYLPELVVKYNDIPTYRKFSS